MDAVHAHPSLSESLHNAARMLAGLYPSDEMEYALAHNKLCIMQSLPGN